MLCLKTMVLWNLGNNSKIFIISGCFDFSYSYDSAEPNGKPCGLLSYGLRKVLEKYNYNCTIENLITEIKKGFGNNNQTPVLSVNSNNIMPSTIVFSNESVQKKTSDKLIKTQNKKKIKKKSKIQNFNFFIIIQNLFNKFYDQEYSLQNLKGIYSHMKF